MQFGYSPYLNSQISKQDADIQKLSSSISEDQQKQILTFYSQINNIQTVIKSRHIASTFFDFLEKNTLKSVSYKNVSIDYKSLDVKMDGTAQSFSQVAQQIDLFKQSPLVAGASIDNSKMNNDKTNTVSFSIHLTLQNI